ncbi:hypothetical protein LCGC14_0561490 [marine sediment metagenome]|uniref:Uncharacterized protein n=1 Tax=marine sediment metagenome TaxID=412755 RepID=A0A0F9S5L2_9ZZZZ
MWALLWFLFLYVVVPVGLGYLGGMLLAPDEPKSIEPAEGTAQSTSWNPRTTQSEGLARPRAYGKNLHHGNIVSKWTDVDGNDREILYMVVEHGDGPTIGIGSNIVYLNDQPASNFGDVNIQERLGTMDQTVMTGFEKTKLQYNIGTELVYNEAQTFTTPNDFFDDIEYMVSFPNGIYKRQKDGDRRSARVDLQVRVRPVGGAWSDESPPSFDPYNTVEPLYFNFKLSDYMTITKGVQYEIEFTKTTVGGDRYTTTMSLRSVREIVNVAFARPGKALIGIKAVATAQLSGNIDVKVIREDRIVNVFNGATWSLEYSNNRAWVAWDILTQPSISGNGGGTPYAIERYDGIDPAYMDVNFFYAWSLFVEEEILDGYGGTEARAACNIIVDQFTDTYSLAQKIATVGRANIYWAGDKLTGWIDTVVTTPIDLVTMDSIIFKSWKNNWAVVSELVGVVEILYQDSLQGYEKTPAEWSNEDAGGFRNISSLEGTGIKTRGPAVHYAKYLITRNELIRNTNEFKVAKDGFRYSLGDVIRLQSRPANWGKAYRVMSSTADTITVDRDVTGDVTAGDVLHIRSYDTIAEQVITDTYEVDSVAGSVITATVAWDVTPVKGNLVATGSAGDVKLRRIIKLQATTDNFFKVTVETYDANLFNADDIDPSNPNVNYIWPGAIPGIGDPVTRADLDDLVAQILPPQPDINVPWPSNLTWAGSGGDTVTWSKTDADDDITFRYAGTTNIIAADSTTDTYIYWNPSSPTVFLTTNLLSTATSAGNWLMAINEAGVVSTPNPHQVMHAGLLQAGTITAAFAQIADAAIVTAKIKDLAVETLKIKDNAVNIPVGAYTESNINIVTDTTVQQISITTVGAFVSIWFGAVGYNNGGATSYSVKIVRDTTTIYTSGSVPFIAGSPFSSLITDSPGSGAHTYYLKFTRNAGDAYVRNRSMVVMEVIK